MFILWTNLKSYQETSLPKEQAEPPFEPKSAAYREYIVEQHKRTIIFFARKYKGMYQKTSFEYEDMINEGVAGLLNAMDCFDSTRNIKFNTYAVYLIKGAMIDAIRARGYIVHLGRGVVDKTVRMHLAEEFLTSAYGRVPEEIELADFLNLPLQKLDKIKFCDSQRLPITSEEYNLKDNKQLMEEIPDEKGHAFYGRYPKLEFYVKKSMELFLRGRKSVNISRNKYILYRCHGFILVDGADNYHATIAQEAGVSEALVSLLLKKYREFMRKQDWFQDVLERLGLTED